MTGDPSQDYEAQFDDLAEEKRRQERLKRKQRERYSAELLDAEFDEMEGYRGGKQRQKARLKQRAVPLWEAADSVDLQEPRQRRKGRRTRFDWREDWDE